MNKRLNLSIRVRDLRSVIKLGEKYSHIEKKLIRDSLFTRGDNTLNPYKNRGARWKWAVVILPGEAAPTGWEKTEIRIVRSGKKHTFSTVKRGFGHYVTYDEWLNCLERVKKAGDNVKEAVGRFKVGIPHDQAASEEDCVAVALTLAYQAHRILGRTAQEIRQFAPELWRAVERFPLLQEPKCPFCLDELTEDGFIREAKDTSDVFYKRKEAEDKVIQLFHIEPLKPGKFLHRPGNVSWGHRRCNVAMGSHSAKETLEWFARVLQNHGYNITRT